MDNQNLRCVMVIDEALPLGIITNTAAVMGVTIGTHFPQMVGENVADKTGNEHLGITTVPIPVLKGTKSSIQELRTKLYQDDFSDLQVVDFSNIAQGCKTYPDYIGKMASVLQEEILYLGLAICGNEKKVNKLTGSMPLLR